jgi:hypothetical protein
VDYQIGLVRGALQVFLLHHYVVVEMANFPLNPCVVIQQRGGGGGDGGAAAAACGKRGGGGKYLNKL